MARTEIAATVTGTVWEVRVSVGETVDAGDEIFIAEAMKMEIAITTPVSGKVVELRAGNGDAIEDGETIAVIEG